MKSLMLMFAGVTATMLLAACDSESPASPDAARRATPVTLERVVIRRVENLERSVGRLEAPATPGVAAETAGRVVAVHVDAGSAVTAGALLAELDSEVQRNTLDAAHANVERLEVLLDNQQRNVSRIRDLVTRELAAESALDDASAQQAALKAQLDEARARQADARRNLQQTRVLSPVSGTVQNRRVSIGDFVTVGQPLFDVVTADRLRAIAPYPETAVDALRLGLVAYVAPVRAPHQQITAEVSELRPQIGAQSRSVDAIIEFDNPGGWRPGASVTVDVVVEARDGSMTVPSESVVRRPAGDVVYVLEDGKARQRTVETGVQADSWIEILGGLQPDNRVIRGGAGFLTDGAPVQVSAAHAEESLAEQADAGQAES